MKTASSIVLALGALLVFAAPRVAQAETDCIACHGNTSLQDASGKTIAGVDTGVFHASLHGSLKCGDCHTTIKDYPHPDQITPVKCESCHADQAEGWWEAYMPTGPSIPAPVATETPTPSFPRTIPGRRSIRSTFRAPAATATATMQWRRSTACPTFIRCISIPSTGLRSARRGCWWRLTAKAAMDRITS